jgi:hypothetical protein
MPKASLATNASLQRSHIVNTNCPTHPATASFGAVTNSLTEWNGFSDWVLKWSNDFDVLARCHWENKVTGTSTWVLSTINKCNA